MKLVSFIASEYPHAWKRVLVLVVVAGLCDSALLALINFSTSLDPHSADHARYMGFYALCLVLFILSKRRSLMASIDMSEQVIHRIRLRVVDKIRQSELPFIETLSQGQIHTKVSQDFNLISQASYMMLNAVQGVVMMVFALLYLAWLSPATFLVTLVFVVAGAIFYVWHRMALWQEFEVIMAKETELFDAFNHMLDGFKEIRINRAKSDAVFGAFSVLSNFLEALKIKVATQYVSHFMFYQVFFDCLVGLVVFVLPQFIPTYGEIVMKCTVALLYIIGPLQMIGNASSFFARANMALTAIYGLEAKLDQAVREAPAAVAIKPGAPALSFGNFKALALHDLSFCYYDSENRQPTFSVGPLSLTVRRGETIFFVGGNGSGKSTAIKLLTGLYPPLTGSITVDDVPVAADTIHAYRHLFTAVFSDFHLFDRLYGLEQVDEAQVNAWIDRMELGDKTRYEQGRFTQMNLSSGQRKRLALIVTLLEDKEIFVFDEWAADQDAHFRQRFYHEILKQLRDRGKTVLAVTHDERFWSVADRVIRMEDGRFQAPAA